MNRTTLADAASRQDNSFNLLRMAAATAVLFSHCFVLSTGKDEDQPLYETLGGMTIGNIAVDIFFIVSGFLVCSSLLARQSVRSFWQARLLRVYPGLVVSVLITLAAAVLTLGIDEYGRFFGNKNLWLFLVKNSTLFFGVWTKIPVVLDEIPYRSVANGSLWTLPFEVRLYLGLGLLWYWTLRLGARFSFLTFERSATLVAAAAASAYLFAADPSQSGLRFTAYFFCGVAYCVYRSRIQLRWDLFLLCAAALAVSTYHRQSFYVVYDLVLGYLILFLAFARVPAFHAYNKLGDYSYGMYIYAFPVQQFIAKLVPGITAWQMLPLAFGVTLILAIVSWRYVEKPALRYRSRRQEARTSLPPVPQVGSQVEPTAPA